MRIGILSQASNFHCQKWAKALVAKGLEVYVFSLEDATIEGVNVIPLTHKKNYTYLTFWKTRHQLKKLLNDYQIEVVNPMHLTPFGTWARWAKTNIPIVAQAMGADVLEYAPPQEELYAQIQARAWANTRLQTQFTWKQRLKYRYFKAQVQQVCDTADYIIPDNEWVAYALERWFNVPQSKFHVAYWGVEPHKFETITDAQFHSVQQRIQWQEGQKVVLSPRGIKPIYQADIIFKAFQEVNSFFGAKVKFVMLGASYGGFPELEQQLLAYAQAYPNFVYLPFVPSEEMPALWKMTDIFVSAPIYDGYSAALAEGRYAGAIPIVNHTLATENLIFNGVNGFILRNFYPKKLAAILTATLNSLPELKTRFAQANLKWTQENGLFNNTVDKFIDVLGKIKTP